MPNLIPYQEYRTQVAGQIKRIETDRAKANDRAAKRASTAAFVVLATLIALAEVGFVRLFHPSLLTLVVVNVAALFVVLRIARWLKADFTPVELERAAKHFDLRMVCPHCETMIDMWKGWRCGWCGAGDAITKEHGLSMPTTQCRHESCNEKPNAIECPHCGCDVIIDEALYLHARTTGKLREGVARFTETFYKQKPLAKGQEPTAKQVERTTQADEKPKRRTPEPGDATKILDEDIS
jgi:rRNA maturation endonuclease Nob1